MSLPEKLYHATYLPRLEQIELEGLHGNSGNKNWDDSKPGVVYLANSRDVAESYAETSDTVDEALLGKIVVLEINTDNLDLLLLQKDPNVIDGQDTFVYHGNIAPKHISVVPEKAKTLKP